jgi:hypothetical protein
LSPLEPSLFGNFVMDQRQSPWSKRLLTISEKPFFASHK